MGIKKKRIRRELRARRLREAQNPIIEQENSVVQEQLKKAVTPEPEIVDPPKVTKEVVAETETKKQKPIAKKPAAKTTRSRAPRKKNTKSNSSK